MRRPFTLPLVLALLLALPLAAGAQPNDPHVEQVRIGFPGGEDAGRSRNYAWAPVYVRIKAGKEGNSQGAFKLVVETSDIEDAPYRFTVPVPALSADSERTVITYVHPGTDVSEFTVRLQAADGREVQALPRLQRSGQSDVLQPRDLLFLGIGSRLPGLKRALIQADGPPAQGAGPGPAQPKADVDAEDTGKHRLAFLDGVAQMPDLWFGYDGVDVVVLATGGDTFVTSLLQESEEPRRRALFEWVRRGGRLVVSVGRNHQLVGELLKKMPVLPESSVTGGVTRKSLPQVSAWTDRAGGLPLEGEIETARLALGREVSVEVREDAAGEGQPMIVQGSCGLGRVVLVAFDLDTPPFTKWEGQLAFWHKLQGDIAPFLPTTPNNQVNAFGARGEDQELVTELKRGLETFEEIPVISFGWVALFILFYIIVVGPLDYLVLKKVFKRLELTWVTFPAVVLTISVAAYFTAYYLKGDDLRVNKIDLVEIDLRAPQQVYGTAWFSLFSPRIRNYTVGVEPAAPGWAAPAGNGAPAATVVSVLEGPGQSLRTGSQSLFRRPYDYAEDASGVERIPIPVWATQSFTASWRAPLPAARPPIEADIRRSRTKPGALWGTIKNNLPIDLQRVNLFYGGSWYELGKLVGTGDGQDSPAFKVETLFDRGARPQPLTTWFTNQDVLRPEAAPGPAGRRIDQSLLNNVSSYQLIKPMLFYKLSRNHERHDSGLRPFDQSWRLVPQEEFRGPSPHREEVILVARAPLLSDRAEAVTAGAASPSRLWLDSLPGSLPGRPALSGFMVQETYVRVYIPVKSE